jgi:archaeal holliday junction resolvase (hjc)
MRRNMSNKKTGNDFEKKFCEILSERGFWVHNFAQNQDGQPADVIAVKNDTPYLIDCKVCKKGIFQLSRLEENQILSMRYWLDTGNDDAWFALKVNDDILMITYRRAMYAKERQSILNTDEIYERGVLLEDWLNYDY